MRTALAALAAACLAAAPLALAQQAPPVYQADATLFLHRDSALTADAPTATDDAVATFDMMTSAFRFESPALQQPWALRGPAAARLTFATTASVQGRLVATLDSEGESLGTSTTEDVLLDFRPREVVLSFTDVRAALPVGATLGLTITLVSAVQVVGPQGTVGASDVQVDLLYDSTAHPSALEVIGVDDPDGPGADGAPGPRGPAGTSTDPNATLGPAGADGTTGGDGNGDGLPQPLESLGAGPVDPFLIMSGVGTSAVSVVVGLAIRGRNGLG